MYGEHKHIDGLDLFMDACECYSPELEDGNYVKLIF
jgi:hypothetical protein